MTGGGDGAAVTFLTCESATASALEARLRELFAHVLGADQAIWPVVRRFEDGGQADVRILIATASPPVERALASGPLVYIQPEMMIAADAFGRLWPDGPKQEAWLELRLLDHALRRCPVIRMEALYAGGAALWPRLAEAVGLVPSGGSEPWPEARADLQGYRAALATLMRSTRRAYPPQASGRFPVCAGGEGLRFLGRGWAFPEDRWTWSLGPAAALVFAACPTGPRACRLRGRLIAHPDRPVRLDVFLDRAPIACIEGPPGEGREVLIDFVLPSASTLDACIVDLLIHDPVSPADVSDSGDRRPLGVALSDIELLDEAPLDAASSPACLRDPLVEQMLGRWTPRLTLVVATDGASATTFGRRLQQLGCPQVLLVGPSSPEAGVLQRLPVAAGVHLLQAGVAILVRQLQDVGAEIDLAVLCDGPAVTDWFAAVDNDVSAQAVARTSLIVNTGDPYVCGLRFNAHASRSGALIQASDVVTIADTWAVA